MKRRKIQAMWKYIRNYRFNSLFFRNFLLILILVALPLVSISVVTYWYSGRILEEEVGAVNTRSLHRVQTMVDMIQQEVDRISIQLAANDSVGYIMTHTLGKYPDFTSIEKLRSVINNMTYSSKDYIQSIYVYSDQNDYMVTPGGGGSPTFFSDAAWMEPYRSMAPREDFRFQIRYRDGTGTTTPGGYVLTYYRKCPLNATQYSGVVVVNIMMGSLDSLLSGTLGGDHEIIFIRDGEGRILYSTVGEWIGSDMRQTLGVENADTGLEPSSLVDFNDETYILSIMGSSVNDWTYCSMIPRGEYYAKQLELRQIIFIALSISMAISILAAFLVSVRVFKPIEEVIDMLEHPTDIPGYEAYDDELKYIAGNILRSYDKSVEQQKEIESRITLLNAARVRALQAQINPHFLYNTLQAASWLILRETGNESSQASYVLEQLAFLVRAAMENRRNMALLSEELDYIEKYVNIQKVRYGDSIGLDIRIPDEMMEVPVLKMSLQPLVENAIEHGIKPLNGPGSIIIHGEMTPETVTLVISDNGSGMDSDQMEEMNRLLSQDIPSGDRHIGIRNVSLRLKLVFGPDAGIRLSPNGQSGLQVIMTLPRLQILNQQDQ